MQRLVTTTWLALLLTASAPSAGATHTVESGETVGAIAERHGTTVAEIVRLNPGLNPDRVRVGQELRVDGAASSASAARGGVYTVRRGDTAGAIAARHGVTLAELRRANPGLNPDRIREGQELTIGRRLPAVLSESVGRAAGGRLVNAEQLPRHDAFTLRNLDRAWATNETVTQLLAAFDFMERRFSRLPRLPVHDLSARHGGAISDHRSHQSGRDVDLGYYQRGCGSACVYQRVVASDLDVERQWALMAYWLERDVVEYMFMDYDLQGAVYAHARERGASREELARWFQYPRGRDAAGGIVRHARNHADHLHVRFKCDDGDRECR